jgi:hypothetical protein
MRKAYSVPSYDHLATSSGTLVLTPLILLIVFGIAALLWSDARAASELATRLGRDACARAGVQWLDQSMALSRLGVRRAGNGRLRLLRQYRFDYSTQGDDRHQGSLALLGRELLWISSPAAAGN